MEIGLMMAGLFYDQFVHSKKSMKNLFTLILISVVFTAHAQRVMFGSRNNYVAPEGPPALVTEGLVLHLDAGNGSSYSGSGSTWTDLSPRANHGTLVNTITHSATNPGYLIFNANGNAIAQGGRNPYVSLPQSTDFDFGTGDFTMEMWAYTTAANPHPDFISINTNAGTYAALRMEYWNNSLNVFHSYDGNSHAPGASIPFPLNSWQQIVVSRISGEVKVYLNGTLKATYSLPGSLLAQQDTRIGDLRGSLGYYSFSGNISIVKFFKNKG